MIYHLFYKKLIIIISASFIIIIVINYKLAKMEPILLLNCNQAGSDLIKTETIELRSINNNKIYNLYLPKLQQFCVLQTADIGALSYQLTENNDSTDTMYLSISKKNPKTQLIHEMASTLKQRVEILLDKQLGLIKQVKAYYGFGDKKITFDIPNRLAKELGNNKIKFRWTIDIIVDTTIVHVSLRILDQSV
ncbi:MAG: hypothetical protein Barrevirus1_20 [Barrevirus sp.]|uniref:Uncharacterized protein n=1 Tax=Barrevirus sp. TaxID=2487763 RepID=A0A3G4ZPH9_9VIRU|nr:MAG: hypothetical protein Barrevirus1_20 [Barrevirus sp.]